MAKKRKMDEEEDEEFTFTPPDFDRKKFVEKEIKDGYASFFTIAYGIIIGLASYSLHRYLGSVLAGMAIGIILTGGIKFVYDIFKVDIAHFTWKNWLGNSLMYFITWLSVWIIMINPPIGDVSAPEMKVLTGDIYEMSMNNTTVKGIEAKIVDNTAVKSVTITFTHTDTHCVQVGIEYTMLKEGEHYTYIPDGGFDLGNYTYIIRATDPSGNTRSSGERKLMVIPAAIPTFQSIIPDITDGSTIDYNTIEVRAKDNVKIARMEYRTNNGTWENIKISKIPDEKRLWMGKIVIKSWPAGDYVVDVRISDQAGNTAEKTLHFSK